MTIKMQEGETRDHHNTAIVDLCFPWVKTNMASCSFRFSDARDWNIMAHGTLGNVSLSYLHLNFFVIFYNLVFGCLTYSTVILLYLLVYW